VRAVAKAKRITLVDVNRALDLVLPGSNNPTTTASTPSRIIALNPVRTADDEDAALASHAAPSAAVAAAARSGSNKKTVSGKKLLFS
jgi:hypothetical protein